LAARVAGSFLASWLILTSPVSQAHAALSFDFVEGPGMGALRMSDSAKADAIMAGVASAAGRWSARIGETVTLKYTIDYDAGLGALALADSVYMAPTFSAVKGALVANVTSPFDGLAAAALQPGSDLKIWINDLSASPDFPPSVDPAPMEPPSVNNMLMDVSRANMKGLGMLPGADGGPGADGTLKFGGADFDFDPTDGIDPLKYDFVGVVLHEIAHSMGFVSGVDTLTTLLPPPVGPPPMPGPDATPMVTVLDLYRYSDDSAAAGLFIPDMSLPVPPSYGFSDERFLSLDGGLTKLEMFSTGDALAGDMHQAGHFKDDPTFNLMDPELATGVELTDFFDGLLSGPPPPDLIALDVIGWTIVPEASPFMFVGLACAVAGLTCGGRAQRCRRRLALGICGLMAVRFTRRGPKVPV
jgi:hypothetical protein